MFYLLINNRMRFTSDNSPAPYNKTKYDLITNSGTSTYSTDFCQGRKLWLVSPWVPETADVCWRMLRDDLCSWWCSVLFCGNWYTSSSWKLFCGSWYRCFLLVDVLLTYSDLFFRILSMLSYADVCSLCWRMLTYADVCWRMLTYTDVCWLVGDALSSGGSCSGSWYWFFIHFVIPHGEDVCVVITVEQISHASR